MKRLLIGTNIVTLALVLVMWNHGCRNPGTNPSAAAMTCAGTCYPFDTSAPFPGLNKALAIRLVENYRKQQWTAIKNSPGGMPDSRSVWFSLSRLKHFIYEIEKNACKSCVKSDEPLGVHIYYAAYPNSNDPIWAANDLTGALGSTKAEMRHTVVLVATRFYNGRNEDFDPRKMHTNPCRPLTMSEIFNGYGDTSSTFLAMVPEPLARTTSGGSGDGGVDNGTVNMMNHGNTDTTDYDGRFEAPLNPNGINPGTINCNYPAFLNYVDQASPPCPQ